MEFDGTEYNNKHFEEGTTMETTFENAKNGDRVWDFNDGFGKIISIDDYTDYPIYVLFDNGEDMTFSFEGKKTKGSNRTLFWDEIKYEIPVRPNRIVKKKACAYGIIYKNGKLSLFHDKKTASCNLTNNAETIVKLTGEYEIEE